jgi:hypothetical protein
MGGQSSQRGPMLTASTKSQSARGVSQSARGDTKKGHKVSNIGEGMEAGDRTTATKLHARDHALSRPLIAIIYFLAALLHHCTVTPPPSPPSSLLSQPIPCFSLFLRQVI